MHSKHWIKRIELNSTITAIEIKPIDIDILFRHFARFDNKSNVPVFYCNSGYENLQKVEIDRQENIKLSSILETKKTAEANYILKFLLQSDNVAEGIYLLDDLCDYEELPVEIIREREALIANLNRKYALSNRSVYIVLLGEYLQFGSRLAAQIPILKIPLPDRTEVETLVRTCFVREEITEKLAWQKLVTALQGLSRGEIELLLQKHSDADINSLVDKILEHKINCWRGIGLEFFAEPDVKSAGGNDLLQKYLHEVVVKLNESGAKQYNLRPPKGMLLMGPPGTGKSLCAKLAAKALGYPLLGLSWGNVLGAHNPDKALAQILEVADCLDNCVILADDFDKGFTGWSEGGASRRLSQRLLTWMQEHTSNALMIATVNRIQLLPSEIKRRFDDGGIWFVDLPHRGAIRDIFLIHLGKYFPSQFADGRDPWSERDWYRLLRGYQGSTPVEIANAVTRCAEEFYCNLSDEERQEAGVTPTVTIERLIAQLSQLKKASIRDAEDLQAIRNKAYYARPAASEDKSEYAVVRQELFEYQGHHLEAG
ncbi:ATP-binding protein [Pleurocapsales cyanobacterium LEGE 10410]|nr:ATP-binding protein [Pleurocapsales cyanobacterium LEGE 10410]